MWRGTKVRMTGDFSSEASAHQKTVEQSLESSKRKKKGNCQHTNPCPKLTPFKNKSRIEEKRERLVKSTNFQLQDGNGLRIYCKTW